MKFESGEMYVFRVASGRELVKEIKGFAEEHNIGCGMVNIIGALKSATLGYFNRNKKKYERIEVDEQSELVSCIGNISLKDNDVFVHLHAVLASRDFSVIGGHLLQGEVYVAEVILIPCKGKMERNTVMDTLNLWPIEK